jgi:hypothetical protein
MSLFEKKMELSKALQSDDGLSSNELLEGINECIRLAFEESPNKLVNAHKYSLVEILAELRFGKPAETQKLITKWMSEISNVDTGWCGELVKCDICGYKWAAVFPDDLDRLECPNCKQMATIERLT